MVARDTEILEAVDGDGNEFFIVNGRPCFFKRTPEWAGKRKPEEMLRDVRNELRLRVQVFIPAMATNLEKVAQTIAALDLQTVKPARVEVVLNQDGLDPADVVAVFQTSSLPEWNVNLVVERNKDGSRVGLKRCLDVALMGNKNHFYSVVLPGKPIPETFVEDLDRAVVDEMDNFVYLNGRHLHGMVVSVKAHEAVGGNREVSLEGENGVTIRLNSVGEKLITRAVGEGLSKLVRNVGEVCRRM